MCPFTASRKAGGASSLFNRLLMLVRIELQAGCAFSHTASGVSMSPVLLSVLRQALVRHMWLSTSK